MNSAGRQSWQNLLRLICCARADTQLSRIIVTPLPAPANIPADQAWLHPLLPESPAIAQGDLRLVEVKVRQSDSLPRRFIAKDEVFASSTRFASPHLFTCTSIPYPHHLSSSNWVKQPTKICCATLGAPSDHFGKKMCVVGAWKAVVQALTAFSLTGPHVNPHFSNFFVPISPA